MVVVVSVGGASDNVSWPVIGSGTVGRGGKGQEPIESSEEGLQVGAGRGHGLGRCRSWFVSEVIETGPVWGPWE